MKKLFFVVAISLLVSPVFAETKPSTDHTESTATATGTSTERPKEQKDRSTDLMSKISACLDSRPANTATTAKPEVK